MFHAPPKAIFPGNKNVMARLSQRRFIICQQQAPVPAMRFVMVFSAFKPTHKPIRYPNLYTLHQ